MQIHACTNVCIHAGTATPNMCTTSSISKDTHMYIFVYVYMCVYTRLNCNT